MTTRDLLAEMDHIIRVQPTVTRGDVFRLRRMAQDEARERDDAATEVAMWGDSDD